MSDSGFWFFFTRPSAVPFFATGLAVVAFRAVSAARRPAGAGREEVTT